MGCRRLLRREGILAGGSSGAVVAALDALADRIPDSARCALVFPDRGERYLETVYNDEWVTAHLGALDDTRSDRSRPWRTAE
jgi:N-(2-amino-2-carboxyethyl)-L-glutamate synthase